MKLWDTNILSELARPAPDAAVIRWVEHEDAIAVSAVTVDELYFGLSWRPRPRILVWFERFLASRCTVLDVTEPIARLAGKLRGRLRSNGQNRTQADMWIAATALSHELPLATRNIKDFEGCGVDLIDPFAFRNRRDTSSP